MYLVILTVVWVGSDALRECVTWVPVRREIRVAVAKMAGVDILRKARTLVGPNGVALDARILMSIKILGVNISEDVESMSVVSGDDDECVLTFAELLEVGD